MSTINERHAAAGYPPVDLAAMEAKESPRANWMPKPDPDFRTAAEAARGAQDPNGYQPEPAAGRVTTTADRIADLNARKDAAYLERNQCVALIAALALNLGYRVGIARTAIAGWDPEWNGCVYIDLPTGQVSWHYHDRDAILFVGMPAYPDKWDEHDTPEKYRRALGYIADSISDLKLQQRTLGDMERGPMTREKCLKKALNCVLHDREETHGKPEAVFGMTATMWSAYTGAKISDYDVAAMMILLKVARFAYNPKHEDGPIDMAGYASIAAELAP